MTRRQLVMAGTAALAVRTLRAQTPPRLTSLIGTLQSTVNPEAAMDHVRRLYATDRWFTFPKFEETARHIEGVMRATGLQRVEVIAAPADGITQAGFWTMPLAWDVRSARLELLDPQQQVLGDYQRVPCSLGMWSGATPPEGITAEVVEFEESEKIRGKLALTKQNPQGLKGKLVRWGALGALNAFSENPALADDRQWINGWGDKGWAFNKGDTPLLCFSLTPRQGELLRGLLATGHVRVKAQVDSRHYAGSYPYVTGVIPGDGGAAEEVLTIGHTSEQGAHDNATGIAAMLESLATLNLLIGSGKLTRPKRTIRMLAVPELYGSMHYVTHNPERIRRTIAAMCLDTPAGSYTAAGTEYTWHLNPHAGASYVDAFILRLAEEYFPRVKRPWHAKPYSSGTDNYLGDPLIGVPTVWPYSGTGIHTHHNSADTPDTVDARSLRDLSIMNAAFLYFLAAAGQTEAEWLAEIALTRAYQQVARAGESSDAAKIAYAAECGMRSVRSAARVDSKARIEPLVRRIEQFRDGLPAKPVAKPEPTGIVVRRKRPGTIPLDEIPEDKREGFPSAAWDLRPMTALYWCDGKRDLADVIRLTRLELGPVDFDFTGYFRFLERKGYVEFVRS